MAATLLLALLVVGPKPKARPRPTPHYWRDAEGKVHMTDTPPPPGAEVLSSPPSAAVEPKASGAPAPAADPLAALKEPQRARWAALRERALLYRAMHDRAGLEALVHEVAQEARWGDGRRATLAFPVLGFAFLALVGWWLALGLHGIWRPAALGLSLLAGLALAQLLVVELVHRPQTLRLREDLRLLVQLSPSASPTRLDAELSEVEQACAFGAAPWRFSLAVKALERRAADLLAGA